MFVRLNSDVVINTNYITAIEPLNEYVVNNNGNSVKYILHMVDGKQWYMTEKDNCEIGHNV